ncbi:MAG: FKBP-type peptidyl-prolyl cis-trans isomerase [Myxococcales bacterium]|nr:FKBP-type peptidyl-prolyl cis-trans isomerase [Myxococcales bacterium]
MPRPHALVLSLLPLVALACPAETTIRPPSHEVPARRAQAAEHGLDGGKDAGKDGGVAGIVAEAAEAAEAAEHAEQAGQAGQAELAALRAQDQAAGDAAGGARAGAAAEPAAPVAGDIPAPPDVAAPPADAKKTASGLAYKVLQPGTGTTKPNEDSVVEVHYSGWTTDGKMFDSSVTRGKPTSFPLKRVIAGWTEGLQLMVEGEKTRFWIPVELAYKDQPGKPAGMLVFDVELLKIVK